MSGDAGKLARMHDPRDGFGWALLDALVVVALLLLAAHVFLPAYPFDSARLVANTLQVACTLRAA